MKSRQFEGAPQLSWATSEIRAILYIDSHDKKKLFRRSQAHIQSADGRGSIGRTGLV
jgi:hypothetical protein